MEPPKPLGAGEPLRRTMPIHFRQALQLKQVSRLEFHEQQGSARFDDQVSERVEVTRALGALEHRIGLRLFERTTRILAPSEAGRLLAERARTLLAQYEAALVGASQAPIRGVLRITAPVQFGRRHVAPIVSAFLNDYPDMRIELTLNDRNLDLIEEGIDVAVRIGGLPDSTLIARQVGSVRRVVVASPRDIAARGMPRVPADLAKHETIFGMARSSAREWLFGNKRRGSIIRLSPRLLVDDVEAQAQAATAGRGAARVLSYQATEELAAGSLVRLLRTSNRSPCRCTL